jgi:hypothetical protein
VPASADGRGKNHHHESARDRHLDGQGDTRNHPRDHAVRGPRYDAPDAGRKDRSVVLLPLARVERSAPRIAFVLLSLIGTMHLPLYMLTVKHQGQNTHNYVDERVWRRRAFVRVERKSNDGLLAFGRLDRPKVKARG